jgi:hypothetical protein
MPGTETSSARIDAGVSGDPWLRPLRVTKPAPVRSSAIRRFAVRVLVVFVIAMGLVVRAELRSLPEQAVEGLLLRAEIKLAEWMPGSSNIVVEVVQHPFSMTQQIHKSASRAGRHARNRSAHSAGRQSPNRVSPTIGLQVQVVPLRALRPFNVELVSGAHRRLLPTSQAATEIEIPDQQSLLPINDGAAAASQAGHAPTRLRAIISSEGRVQDLRLLQGPLPSPAVLDLIRQAHYRPLMADGAPVETEALIILDSAAPSLPAAAETSQHSGDAR